MRRCRSVHEDIRCQLEGGHRGDHHWSAPWPEFERSITWPNGRRAPRTYTPRKRETPQLEGQLAMFEDRTP